MIINREETIKAFAKYINIWKYPVVPFIMYCLLFQIISPYLGNPIIDTYTDLWVGFELFSGKTLYSEVLYPYGPTVPLLFKYLLRIIGSSQTTYRLVSFVIPLSLIILCWLAMKAAQIKHLQRNLVLIFLLLTLFFNPSVEIFSIVRTYSWSSVMFVIAILGIANECMSKKTSYISPLLFILAATTRPTMFAPIALVIFIFFIYQKRYAELALSLILSVISFNSLLGNNFTDFLQFITAHARAASQSQFHKTIIGINSFSTNLQNLVLSLIMIGSLTTLACKKRIKTWIFFTIALPTTYFAYNHFKSANIFYFSVPIITLLLSASHAKEGKFEKAFWGLLSFMLVMRFTLLCDINLNSALFIVPSLTYLLSEFLKELTSKKILLISLILIATIHEDISTLKTMDTTSIIMGSPHHSGSREKQLTQELSKLVSRLKSRSIHQVQVLPEGTFINLELGSPSPMSMLPLVPTHLIAIGEKRIISELKTTAPKFILLIERDYSEYYETRFGESYGKKILNYIQDTYKVDEKKEGLYTLYTMASP